MCGILGVYSKNNKIQISDNELIGIRDLMTHRGPDDSGIFTHKTDNIYLGFAHRRLSILDLSSSGHQPMCSEDGRFWIIFNGEIFNFKTIRKDLEKKYKFHSNSDTEVLIYSIIEWGIERCLSRLRGMYAFAIFDKKDCSLTLARDPLGVKPLYYSNKDGVLSFASEIKCLLSMKHIEKSFNEKELSYYLTFANIPSPETLFLGINKLEAGTYLKISAKDSFQKVTYWDPKKFQPDSKIYDEIIYIEETRRLLRQSVKRRMVSDVPFGVFLSGGVDSSLNVALMAELMDRPVETFSVGIEGDPANELIGAKKVADYFHANYNEIIITENDFIQFLPEIGYLQDEPLADPVCIPLFYVSKLAKDSGTKVIQVGEGSDEIFAGYQMYHLFNMVDKYAYTPYSLLPKIIKSNIYKLMSKFAPVWLSDSILRAYENHPLFIGNAVAFWDIEIKSLFLNNFHRSSSSKFIQSIVDTLPSMDPLLRIINIELKNRLPELLLMRVDKMSMANSIETRVPFLDEDLVEFALKIPSKFKYRFKEPKYILKKAAEGIIPNEIIYKKKWGFCGSATNMLTKNLSLYAHSRIFESKVINDYFNLDAISKLFNDYEMNKRFNSFKIWNLLNLVLWYDRWF